MKVEKLPKRTVDVAVNIFSDKMRAYSQHFRIQLSKKATFKGVKLVSEEYLY
jgi:hypothetical protein